MVMGLDLDMLSLIISFMDYCCRTLVFLLPVFPSSHPTHQCQNHHARAPTPTFTGALLWVLPSPSTCISL